MLLNEILSSKVNYDVTKASNRLFKTEAKIGNRLIAFSAELEDEDSGQWNILFAEGSGESRTYSTTGSGAAFEVFAMVAASIKEFIDRYHPTRMIMTAEGDARATVYRKLLNRLKGYDFDEDKIAGEHQFILTKV